MFNFKDRPRHCPAAGRIGEGRNLRQVRRHTVVGSTDDLAAAGVDLQEILLEQLLHAAQLKGPVPFEAECTCGGFAVDAGFHFGWRSRHDVSMWDFGLGCQYHDRTFTPTVSVGLCIWGVPVTIGLGVVLLSLGAG